MSDDAGVYELEEGFALIQTIDVITPIVDDPFLFGRIAAANSISDIYAMGGKPLTALNFLAFPEKQLPFSVASEILKGGMDACEEAGCALLGGHTIGDDEVKYGLSVTGTALVDDIVANSGMRVGNAVVLTKPLGTGIISTAVKNEKASVRSAEAAAKSMATLNKTACEAMLEVGVDACTDITGFGLCGHAAQMANASGVTIEIESASVPLLPGALSLASKGSVPGGTKNNYNAYKDKVRISKGTDPALIDVLFDAQTSGGLLICVPEKKCAELIENLKKRKCPASEIIGRVVKKSKESDIILK